MNPATAPTTASVSLDHLLDDYERDGLVLVERLMSAEQLAAAQSGVAWAMANIGGNYKFIKQRTYEWFRVYPVFAELLEHPLVIRFARAVLGEDFHVIAAQCSRNTRDEHYATGVMQVHQDAVFFPSRERAAALAGVAEHHEGFSAMWYLQDTPLEMGPTELVRGSHRHGERKHTNAELEANPRWLWRRAVPAGSLLIFSHRTWHRGALNQTDRPRDLITHAYARPQIDKVQLTVKQDGVERYVACDELLREASDLLRQMLAPR